jgi:CheY-like chemotaxis protein
VVDINETIKGFLKMLQRIIGEDIDLAWIPGTGLWPIKVDPSQMDQILANLCVNARDSILGVGKIIIETSNGSCSEEFCSTHSGCVSGDYVKISVSDNGHGMDKLTLTHIFEPFFTTKEVGAGTGLGLATVYGVVKQHNGFIDVYSEPEKGTIFKIYLPRHKEVGIAGQTSKEGVVGAAVGGNETILLVEDEPAILKMTARILQSLGYDVITASNPGEAVRLVKEFKAEIHLLMTDVIMPGMNGRDLADRLMTLKKGMKCLFMSGYTSDIVANQGVLSEGVSFIQKPFSQKELAAKIRDVFNEEKSV